MCSELWVIVQRAARTYVDRRGVRTSRSEIARSGTRTGVYVWRERAAAGRHGEGGVRPRGGVGGPCMVMCGVHKCFDMRLETVARRPVAQTHD